MSERSPHFWPAFLADLPVDKFPNLAQLKPDLAAFTDDEQFVAGLLSVLAGLEAEREFDRGRGRGSRRRPAALNPGGRRQT